MKLIDTLGKKIGVGYTLATLILTIAVTTTLLMVNSIRETSERLSTLRYPTSNADIELLNGINHSIASLRGWILLKNPSFEKERKQAWEEEIKTSLAKLESLSQHWTNPENVERLSIIKSMIYRMEEYQEQVVKLTVTDRESAIGLMEERVVETNVKIKQLMEILRDNHKALTDEDFRAITTALSQLNITEWVLLGVGVFISILMGVIITRSIVTPISGAVGVANSIASGNLDTAVDISGSKELKILGQALGDMQHAIKTKTEETAHYNWLSTGQNKLNEVVRGDKQIEELGSDIIEFIARYINANIGALYLNEEESNVFSLKGSFAFTPGKEMKKSYKKGEGLIGQAAADGQFVMLDEMDEKHLRLASSMVDMPPKHIFICPFIFAEHTLGVVEIGKIKAFSEGDVTFLTSVMESIGIAMNSAIVRNKVQELLEETQQQAEELQMQQEELQQSNEELEEQTQELAAQQEELEAANEELEEQAQMVEEKNKGLETARMDIELKAKRLEVSSKYKSEFLANMSHELRTPLNSLLILSNDLLQNNDDNLNEDQLESARVITKSGYDLLNLINDILDLSKVEAGKLDINSSEFGIEELARDISANFNHMAKEKGLKFGINIQDGLPQHINTDRKRLEQIIKNMVSNAIKFTEKGSVAVDFKADAGNNLNIVVKDTGIGIAEDKRDVVFEAFQQGDGSISRKYGGTGLGLSISRELAKLLGGKITLKSEKGKGSIFTLNVPFTIAEEETNEISLSSSKAILPDRSKEPIQNDLSGSYVNYPTIPDQRHDIEPGDQTMLIIEDDETFAKVLADQTVKKGFKYLVAATGEDGLILARQYQPHAIILDLDLPGISGHMVLKEIKSNADLRHIPVHVISANERTLDPIKSGALEYLTKPVSKAQLEGAFNRIENLLSRKMKNLLVLEDDSTLRKSIIKLIGNGDVQCFEAGSGYEAISLFDEQQIDCLVLDMGLPDMTGFEFIKKLEKSRHGNIPPIIVYTGRDLSKKENEELQQYAETVIVKGVKSEERLLDETALFLHRTIKNLPSGKQAMITGLYDNETPFMNKKVLVVDDDMRNVFALSKVLKDKGIIITKAENGVAALAALDEDPTLDMVLMDIMMPEMDGYECMKKIREQDRFRELPIIALTAKAMKEDRQICIDAGANDYITKPVDVGRLLSLMRVWMRK